MKTFKKRNVSIRDFCKVEDTSLRSKHVSQFVPGSLFYQSVEHKNTTLDDELNRLALAGAKVLGFKRVGDGFVVKTMVPL